MCPGMSCHTHQQQACPWPAALLDVLGRAGQVLLVCHLSSALKGSSSHEGQHGLPRPQHAWDLCFHGLLVGGVRWSEVLLVLHLPGAARGQRGPLPLSWCSWHHQLLFKPL